MLTYIAVLRGINVGGKRKILMADLKQLFQDLGFKEVTTYIQSGNILFDSAENLLASDIEDLLEEQIFKTFGFKVPVIVLISAQLREAIENNPFYISKEADVERLHLTLLKSQPLEKNLEKIKDYPKDNDDFKINGGNVFIYCSGKYSDSKFSNSFFESKLKVPSTTRNWKTVLKLNSLVEEKK